MKPLGLKFTFDELGDETREVRGEVAPEALDEVVRGMVGELGYRAESPARVEGTAYAAGHDVMLQAHVTAAIGFDCVRCLTARTLNLDFDVRHLLVKRGAADEFPDEEMVLEAGDEGDDDEVVAFDGDTVDLVPVVREDVLLELPMNPTCENATGNACGDLPGVDRQPEGDPRWAPLLDLKKKLK
jgi:uncharacterized protein